MEVIKKIAIIAVIVLSVILIGSVMFPRAFMFHSFEIVGTMVFLVCGVEILRKWLFADNTKDWNKYLFHLFLLVIVFFVWSNGFYNWDDARDAAIEKREQEALRNICWMESQRDNPRFDC